MSAPDGPSPAAAGPAVDAVDARARLAAAADHETLAEVFAALRGGAVGDETLWAMMTARFDALDAGVG